MTSAHGPSLAVVVSTYDWPEALDAALRSLADQSDSRFDVVVADDGSGPETKAVVERWRAVFADRLAHVWQPDEGFRAARVRNLGALAASPGSLVFLDGDCVPRRHFVRALRSAAASGWFVATNRVGVSPLLTRRILEKQSPIQRWPSVWWMVRQPGSRSAWALLTRRDRRRVGRRNVPEFAPHLNAYCCLGVASDDFELVNGYDTRYVGWGDEDVDLAVRLRRSGLRCGHAGSRAVPLHLWHPPRTNLDRENWWLLQETEQSDRVEAMEGLREVAADSVRARTAPT